VRKQVEQATRKSSKQEPTRKSTNKSQENSANPTLPNFVSRTELRHTVHRTWHKTAANLHPTTKSCGISDVKSQAIRPQLLTATQHITEVNQPEIKTDLRRHPGKETDKRTVSAMNIKTSTPHIPENLAVPRHPGARTAHLSLRNDWP